MKEYIYEYGPEHNCKCIMTLVCLYDHVCVDRCIKEGTRQKFIWLNAINKIYVLSVFKVCGIDRSLMKEV